MEFNLLKKNHSASILAKNFKQLNMKKQAPTTQHKNNLLFIESRGTHPSLPQTDRNNAKIHKIYVCLIILQIVYI